MAETCGGNNNYKYNEKTSNCLLNTENNQNVIITEDGILKYKDDLHIYKDKKEHCNNYSEKWQDWFCIKYYYLNNNYEQGIKNPEDALTNTISECFKPCEDNYVALNNSDKCESLKTFKNKKYDGFLPYDPFAIICIIASHYKPEYIYKDNNIGGNHSNVLCDIVTSNDWSWLTNSTDLFEINTTIISDSNISKISSNIWSDDIKNNVKDAYIAIEKYIRDIKSENEQDHEKIKNNIKSDLYKFFVLFDKRDELYINYLNHINIKGYKEYIESIKTNTIYGRGGTGGGGGMKYAYHLSSNLNITDTDFNITENGKDSTSNDIDKYVRFLFYHACDMCFSKTSILSKRLQDFLNIDSSKYNLLDDKEYENDIFFNTPCSSTNSQINKPLIPVKIEKDNIKIFGEYTEVFNYYKNILNLFPIILLIIIAITVIFAIFKITDTLVYPLKFINRILSAVLLLVLFIMKLIVNSSTIGIISYLFIQPAIYIYEKSLFLLKVVAISVAFLHIEPSQIAAPINNNGVDKRWILFNTLSSIFFALINIIATVIQELLKNNIAFSLTAFFIYTIYEIIIKGDDVMDIIINADTSFLNIIDLKYKMYKNKKLLGLYKNYITSMEKQNKA